MFTCEFCGKELSTKTTLRTHQEKAKYCLEKQNNVQGDIKCVYCNKEFSHNHRKETHEMKCQTKIENEKALVLITLNNKVDALEKETFRLKTEIDVLKREKEIYTELFNNDQRFILEQSKRLVEKSGVTTTTNIKAKTITMNALNLSQERLESIKDTYTIKDYERGGIGQADWVIANILTDDNGSLSYRCTDKNRKNFIYHDDKGNVVNDMEAKKLKEAILPIMNIKLREYKKTKFSELAEEDDDDNSKLDKVNDLYIENKELGIKFDKRLVEKTYV
ncbi:MAG: hypothetical protein PHG66_00635 [Candidatus Colwellbacteria bacterium]|nr:hypothetical protein [Candidatus Colwellbacteria bacterium]